MQRALLAVGLLAVTTTIVACFTLSFQDGTIRCSTDPARPCPSGNVCVNGLCWRTSDDFGLPSTDAGSD